GPRHLCVVGIDRVAERVDMSRGGAGDQIRALRTRRILALTGSNYHGGHRTNTYRFRGVRRFLNSAQVATAEADAPARPVTWKPSQLKEKLSSFLLKLPAERDGGRVASRRVITK